MNRKIVLSVLLAFAMATSAMAAETVTFKGTATTKGGKSLMLTGKLTKPQGDGPFAALVLLHACDGMNPHLDAWAKKLESWGYVALQLDSFGPRSVSDICDDHLGWTLTRYPSATERLQDADDAKSYLAALPFVDRSRIAVMGWGHGSCVILRAVQKTAFKQILGEPFRVAVTFYPRCDQPMHSLNTPLLILIGELSTWCRATECQKKIPSGKTTPEVKLKIYPGAYHGFDREGLDETFRGHRFLYNREAAVDAVIQVKNFLAKHLK